MRWSRRERRGSAVTLPPLAPLAVTDPIAAVPLPEPTIAPRELASQPVRDSAPAPTRALLDEADLRPTPMWERIAAVAEALSESLDAARGMAQGHPYPLAAYDRFRRDIPIRPPPGALPRADGLIVIVDASMAAPFLLRETLRSLQDQSVRDWRAIVLAAPQTHDHPVASFVDTDTRIAFAAADAAVPGEGRVLLVTAGTMLDPEALAWLLFAATRVAAAAVFADHDRGVSVAGRGALRSEPWLYGARDRVTLRHIPAPALVLADAALAARCEAPRDGSDTWRRAVLIAAPGPVPHVARMLSTIIELPLASRGGRPVREDRIPGHLAPLTFAPPHRVAPPGRDDRIAIVIPTRDAAAMLRRTIETLRATARAPERLDIVVVDNRSVLPETAQLLETFEGEGNCRRVAFDHAFNWGLASNVGARSSDAPILLFANNDLEMMRRGWDDLLLDSLADEGVGAVGARLLYPNRTVQHAGIVFGLGPGTPEHEGRDYPAVDPGPCRRLVTPRNAAAMTGAFLACRRDLFEAIRGFDVETMFVAYSDIDFCLKVREAGFTVRYDPRIEAIHHESATRGRNETKAQVAWDEGERADLLARWGDSVIVDAGVSPYWAKGGLPFDGLREPSLTEIVRHIDLTGSPDPWRPTRRDAQHAAAWSAAASGAA